MEKTVSEYGSRSASDAFTVASSQESLPEKTLSAYASRTASDASSQDSLLKECLDEHGLTTDHAGFVRWRNDNPRHPRNWTLQAKVYNTVIVLLLEFITSAVGTAGTAAAQDLQNDFKINLDLLIVCLTSSYLVGQCVGGIFFPPFSEVFGRKTLYIVSTIIYAVSSVIAASVHLLPVVVVARMMSGLASAIPTIVVAGSIEDVFNSRARVWWIFVWASVGTAAVAVGPIFGSYVTQSASLGWRWVFYMPAIGLGIVLGFCLTLKETRPSLLLCREAAVVKRRFPDQKIQILNPDEVPGFRALVTATLLRPLRLLFTEPIIAAVAFMGAVTTVLFYAQAESIPLVFQLYGWSPAAASLGFVPLLLGSLTSFLVRFVDQHKLDKIVRNNQRIEPEDKLTGFAIAAPFLAFGMWLFAWSTPSTVHIHWIVPLIAQVFVGFALNEYLYTLSGYLADSYTILAASGFAGMVFVRALTCASLVPFTKPMYVNLGYNIATTVLAVVATVFCLAPIVFIKYGRRIREASKFAKLSLATYDENKVEDDFNGL